MTKARSPELHRRRIFASRGIGTGGKHRRSESVRRRVSCEYQHSAGKCVDPANFRSGHPAVWE